MEHSAPWFYCLWIFSFVLRPNCSTGWGGLQGEGEPELLHRPEQPMFWIHEEQDPVLLWYLLSENRGLLQRLSECVPNIWWVVIFIFWSLKYNNLWASKTKGLMDKYADFMLVSSQMALLLSVVQLMPEMGGSEVTWRQWDILHIVVRIAPINAVCFQRSDRADDGVSPVFLV